MKNKIKLKKYIVYTFLFSVIIVLFFLLLNAYEYHAYTKNFNDKLASILTKVKDKYPNVTENEIMEIINSKDTNVIFFEKYGICLDKDSLLIENNHSYSKFLFLNVFFISFVIGIFLFLFSKYNKRREKEISKITKYIEEINKKNYKLDMDELSEDELSILKNEIYKTTVMLKEQAENSKKEKVELKDSLSDISHQLKTPLTSILIILDNLIDDPDMEKETRDDFIRDIKREILNINFLAQSILKLSKLDSNTVHFVKEKVFIKNILEESIKKVAPLCDLKNIKIEVSYEEESAIVCDLKWQAEAITNIIKNCVEHSKSGSVIEIKNEDNKVYSKIEIKDYGEGISKEELPHIFERFYKGKNATSDSIGIGLSLAKSIIDKNNGSLNVVSSNEGTIFTIKYYK